MNCRQARRLVSAYLDSELDGTATVEVNRHLETCASCRSRFAAELEIEAGIARRLRRAEPGEEDEARRIVAAVCARRARPPRRALLVAGAAVALAAGGGLLLLLALPPPVPALVHEAVRDHGKLRSGELEPQVRSSRPREVREHLEAALGVRLGRLPAGPGWRIRGSRLCRLKRTLVGLVMLERGPEPVSLFVLSPDAARRLGARDPEPGPRAYATPDGSAVLCAAHGVVRCAVGEVPLAELEALVRPR